MRITPALLVIGLAVSGALAPATLASPATSGVTIASGASAASGATVASGVTVTAKPPGTVQLAVIAPLTVPPGIDGMLDRATLEEYTTPGGLLATQLGQLGGRDVTLAIDPMILASIRSLGTSAPEAATSWLNRLAEARNASFALEWADANPVLTLQGGQAVLGAPNILLDSDLFAPEGADTGNDLPGEPDVPALPTQEDLVAWAHVDERVAWPADHTVNAADLTGLDEAGFDAVIVNSGAVAATTIKSPHVALGAIDGIVSDDLISSLLRATVGAPSTDAWALAFDGLSSAIALHTHHEGPLSVVATLGRIDQNAPLRLSQTLDALANLDWVELVPVSEVFTQPAVSTNLESVDIADPRATTLAEVIDAEQKVRVFADVLDAPESLVNVRRARLLALLSSGWDPASRAWQTAADHYLADCRSILGAVAIQDSSRINLLADNGSFPVTVRNNLAHAVTVFVTVEPDRPILRVMNPRVELSIAANSQAKAMVPVQTVANGSLFAAVTLSSANHTSISTPVRVGLNVQAGWETPATIIVISLVGLMLVAGIWRTIRTRRRTVVSLKAGPAEKLGSPTISNDGSAT